MTIPALLCVHAPLINDRTDARVFACSGWEARVMKARAASSERKSTTCI